MKRAVNKEDIITLDELAAEMEVTIEVIEKWRKKGMPVIKIDKFVRAYRPRVYEWLVKQEEKNESDDVQGGLFEK